MNKGKIKRLTTRTLKNIILFLQLKQFIVQFFMFLHLRSVSAALTRSVSQKLIKLYKRKRDVHCVCVCTERPYLHWLPGLVGLAAAAAAVSHQLWFLPIPLDSHIYYIKIF